MYDIEATAIRMTRGDTIFVEFPLAVNNEPYQLQEGDVIQFAVKEDYDSVKPVICKALDGYVLRLDPEDTKPLPFGKYVYDVQITFANKVVITYIEKAKFVLDKEVG